MKVDKLTETKSDLARISILSRSRYHFLGNVKILLIYDVGEKMKEKSRKMSRRAKIRHLVE